MTFSSCDVKCLLSLSSFGTYQQIWFQLRAKKDNLSCFHVFVYHCDNWSTQRHTTENGKERERD